LESFIADKWLTSYAYSYNWRSDEIKSNIQAVGMNVYKIERPKPIHSIIPYDMSFAEYIAKYFKELTQQPIYQNIPRKQTTQQQQQEQAPFTVQQQDAMRKAIQQQKGIQQQQKRLRQAQQQRRKKLRQSQQKLRRQMTNIVVNRLESLDQYGVNIVRTTNIPSGIIITKDKPNVRIVLDKVKELSGGKSGDKVYIVKQSESGKEYVLKLFKQQTTEATKHIEFYNLFKESGMVPKLYMYGKMEGDVPFNPNATIPKGTQYQFYIMEYVSPSIELNQVLQDLCKDKTSLTPDDMKALIMQLFYFLSKIYLAKLKHCDLHSKNILIIKDKGTMKFSHLLDDHPYDMGKYRIKVIDFGLSKSGDENCDKCRDLSGVLRENKKVCNMSSLSDVFSLAKGQLSKKACSQSVDMAFFSVILEIFSSKGGLPLIMTSSLLKNLAINPEGRVQDIINIYSSLLNDLYQIELPDIKVTPDEDRLIRFLSTPGHGELTIAEKGTFQMLSKKIKDAWRPQQSKQQKSPTPTQVHEVIPRNLTKQQYQRFKQLIVKEVITPEQSRQFEQLLNKLIPTQYYQRPKIGQGRLCYQLGKDKSGIFCPSDEVIKIMRQRGVA
jgi:serine/threonine protein kinase